LSYKDSIRHFFPKFPYENITVHDLLTHYSGLPEYFYFTDSLWKDKHKQITNQDVIDMMIEHEPKKYYSPDYRYNYSNTNYSILASIIEKVSGKTYKDFMESEIFAKLNMNNTMVYDTVWSVIEDFDVMGHKNRWRRIRDFYLNGVVGDKGVYSCVEDLFKWDRAMYNGELVKKEELEKAFTPAHDDLYSHDNYGFGWRIDASDKKDKFVYHAGWWRGFRTFLVRRLKTEQTFIVLTNVDGYNPVSIQTLKNLMKREKIALK
jgi:CubicO group peptidase (beta-lactamase class C family)